MAKNILIELPTWLGDSVMTTPAIENIFQKFKDAKFSFIGPKTSLEVFKYHPRAIDFFVFDKSLNSSLKILKKRNQYDFFISFRSSFRSKILGLFINSDIKTYYKKKKFNQKHQVEKYSSYINEVLNLKNKTGNLKIYLRKDENKDYKNIIGISPGAKYGNSKCWPLERYAELAVELSKEYKVVIFGSESDTATAEKIVNITNKKLETNIENLTGKTSIVELCVYMKSMKMFITGDSGSMHIAAAFQTPTISIFGSTDSVATCQWNNKNSKLIKKNLSCQPCMKRECPLGHHRCMKDIQSDEVILEAKKLLRKV